MAIEIDGYSLSISPEYLLIIARAHLGEKLPEFSPEEITLTVLEDGSLNVLITKGKQDDSI